MVTGAHKQSLCDHGVVTGVQKKSLCGNDMVTGGSEEIRNGHDMVTGLQEEIRNRPHMVTGVTEEIPSSSPVRRAPQVSNNFAVRKPLRQLKQTRFCWPFNNWRLTATPPVSTTTLANFQNCPNPS